MATCPVHWSSLPALSAPPESQFTIIIQIVKIKSSSLLQGVPLPGQSDLLGEDPGDSSEHPAFLCCCLSSIQKKNTLSDLEEDLDLDSEEKGGKGWELLRFAALSFCKHVESGTCVPRSHGSKRSRGPFNWLPFHAFVDGTSGAHVLRRQRATGTFRTISSGAPTTVCLPSEQKHTKAKQREASLSSN